MDTTKTPERNSKRTKIITVTAIGGVALASLFAIGANIGILTNTDQSKVGALSATADLAPPDTRVVDVYLDQAGNPLPSTSSALPGSKRFTVDAAGTVDVSADAGAAHIDLVSPASGWTAAPVATAQEGVAVAFTDGTRTLEFTAVVGPDQTVTGDVTEATGATSARGHDDHRSDRDHHADDDHHGDDGHGHDGSDDDD